MAAGRGWVTHLLLEAHRTKHLFLPQNIFTLLSRLGVGVRRSHTAWSEKTTCGFFLTQSDGRSPESQSHRRQVQRCQWDGLYSRATNTYKLQDIQNMIQYFYDHDDLWFLWTNRHKRGFFPHSIITLNHHLPLCHVHYILPYVQYCPYCSYCTYIYIIHRQHSIYCILRAYVYI